MVTMVTAPAPRPSEAPDSAPRRRLASDDLAPEDRDNPLAQYMLSLPAEQAAAMDLLAEAAEHYGDDLDQSLADIQAGKHVLQRDGQHLDAWQKHHTELAAIREKLLFLPSV